MTTETETTVAAQIAEPKSTMEDPMSGKELTAATALTSLVTSTIGEPEEQDDESVDDGEANAHDADFDIPQRYTRSGRRRAVSFPLKLMKVLSSKNHTDVIAWMPSGKAFSILDSKRFVADVLPGFFKNAKFSSFTRKLHRWGFLRHYRGEESGAYYHESFQKGRLDLVEAMTCHKQDNVPPAAMSMPLERQREQLITTASRSITSTPSASLQRPGSALQTALARSRLPPAPQMGAADLSAAIEFEVARRIREKINEDALNRRALALLREQQQLMQQRQQDQHLLMQLKRQQEQRLQLLAAMPLANPNQLRWSQQGIHMLKTLIPNNGKLSLAPAGSSPSDVQPFQSLPKTNITGAKTA